jgi:large conductance mechanosensitive channel
MSITVVILYAHFFFIFFSQTKFNTMFKEFKNFIMTGNVLDFAIGVILAGAVGAVVNGFVSDIMMPVVGHLAGGVDFSQFKFQLTPDTVGADGKAVEGAAIMYGKWLTSIFSLITTGLVLFIIVNAKNKANPPAPAAPAGPSDNDLLMQIRDALKK